MSPKEIVDKKLINCKNEQEVLDSILLTYDGLGIEVKREVLDRLLALARYQGGKEQLELSREMFGRY